MATKHTSVTTMSSRELNQDTNKAKKAAKRGPVFITDRARPTHVLLTIEHYQQLLGSSPDITTLLAMPGSEDIELEIPTLKNLYRPAKLR